MSIQRRGVNAFRIALAAAAVFGGAGRASADLLYGSAGDGNTIFTVDTATGAVNTQFRTPTPPPDGLIFTGSSILYLDQGNNAVAGSGQLRSFNINTRADTLIAGGLSRPADLTLDGSNTVLVSEFNAGRIDRINVTTGAVSVLGNYGGTPNGLTFDASGRLFAVLGSRFTGPTGSSVSQLNPTTGAIIATSTGLNSADGLTYDSFSGRLFTASTLSNLLYSINPNNLSDVVSITLPGPGDGVVSNGRGDLFIGGRQAAGATGAPIYDYKVTSRAVTQVAFVPGAVSIDLAAVPEPSSVALFAIGTVACGGWYGLFGRRRSRVRAAV